MKLFEKLKAALKNCQADNLVVTALLCVVVLVGMGYIIFAPKQEFSEEENRALEPAPALTAAKLADGSFMKAAENFVGDHFMLRRKFVELNTAAQLALGKRDLGANYAESPAEGGVYFGNNGHLYEVLLPSRDDIFARNAAALGKLGEGAGLPTYLLPVPSGSQEQPSGLPAFAPNHDQREELAALQKSAGRNTKVLDVFETLDEKNGDFYFKTDHHWNLEGAYLGYRALAQAMGIAPTPRSDYTFEKTGQAFYGTLYSKAIYAGQEADDFYLPRYNGKQTLMQETGKATRDSLYWEEFLSKKDKYSAFLGGNHSLDVVRNAEVRNGRHLLIIKDSYANSMVPFLAANFEEIHIIDPRYYSLDIFAYAREAKITEIAAVYSIKQLCDVSISNKLAPRG